MEMADALKRITQTHGGEVGVQSSLGRGCVFWFELPRSCAASPGVSAAS